MFTCFLNSSLWGIFFFFFPPSNRFPLRDFERVKGPEVLRFWREAARLEPMSPIPRMYEYQTCSPWHMTSGLRSFADRIIHSRPSSV